MELLFSIGIIVLLTLVTGLMAAAETSALLVSRGRVRRLVEAEHAGSRGLDRVHEHPSRLRGSSALVGLFSVAVASATGGWALWSSVTELPGWGAASIGALFATGFVFAFGQALPRSLAVQNPERVALSFCSLAMKVTALVYPAVRLLGSVWRWGFRLTGGERADVSPWATEDEFRAVAVVDEENAAREETEEALIDAVADFTEKVVREVMVPRPDMAILADTASAVEAIDVIESSGYSRVPVFRDTVDDIRGILYAKDLLIASGKVGVNLSDLDIVSIARPAYFVPETKPIQELLLEMRSRTHIAIVADEYGGTAGLVTIEDLLEEIVGEIFDEYDSEVPLVVPLGNGAYRVDSRLPVDDLNERFGTAIEMDADTAGGVFTELAGRIPEVGEHVEIDGLCLTVGALEGTRIRQLIVEPVQSNDGKEAHDA